MYKYIYMRTKPGEAQRLTARTGRSRGPAAPWARLPRGRMPQLSRLGRHPSKLPRRWRQHGTHRSGFCEDSAWQAAVADRAQIRSMVGGEMRWPRTRKRYADFWRGRGRSFGGESVFSRFLPKTGLHKALLPSGRSQMEGTTDVKEKFVCQWW